MSKNKANIVLGYNFHHLGNKAAIKLFPSEQDFVSVEKDDPAVMFTFTSTRGKLKHCAPAGYIPNKSTLVVFHRCDDSSERALTKKANKDAVPRYRVGYGNGYAYFEKGQVKIPEYILFVELNKDSDTVKDALLTEVLPGPLVGDCHGTQADVYQCKRITTIDPVACANRMVKSLQAAGISHMLWPNFTHQNAPWWC